MNSSPIIEKHYRGNIPVYWITFTCCTCRKHIEAVTVFDVIPPEIQIVCYSCGTLDSVIQEKYIPTVEIIPAVE